MTGQAAEIAPATVITEGKTPQGFPYLFDGVSSNEREAIEARAKEFDLMLVFAEKNSPYRSAVQVVLASAQNGEILAITVDGPWFHIQLPPGTYEVKATFKGQTKQMRNLRVMEDQAVKQTFIWGSRRKTEP